ncbi:hypothetical protein M011DRAFT_471185 [Sporormia fimetaria CBS 119925]|uniref:Alpha/beta-hydrolase n=1 Tax=Sporormia fimetaria CBS 119925 TaxID=1340428 RepID=A0A6A6UZE8_9PLEO|nr:hypothetical protein M011DRAFT_471185 [Sporormia fimetaria CBS 119925]
MFTLPPIFKKSYWILAAVGGIWALFIGCLIHPTVQRHVLYGAKLHTGYFGPKLSDPEAFGFAKGQVQPFHLNTSDGETLFCWHVLPLDVYLEHENELVQKAGGVVEDLKETVGWRLLRDDGESRVVVSFHGFGGHIASSPRPQTYLSLSSIPRTHTLTCSYRGFSSSTLRTDSVPTETGLITDGISLLTYLSSTLSHPTTRTLLLGDSLGSAVAAASALYFTAPSSPLLPSSLPPLSPNVQGSGFAGIVLMSAFPDLPTLLKTYKLGGIFPVLTPLRPYPKIATYITNRLEDDWDTRARLDALLSSSSHSSSATTAPLHITLLHARNNPAIDFRLSESLYASLQKQFLGGENVVSADQRRTIQGGERVKRGAFAFKAVVDEQERKSVEVQVVRGREVGLHVGLAVRRRVMGGL